MRHISSYLPFAMGKGTMADSDFWRDLAAQFRNGPDTYHLLHADWVTTTLQVANHPPQTSTEWSLKAGNPGDVGAKRICVEFEALATRGGAQLAKVGDPRDPLVIWLEALRNETNNIGGKVQGSPHLGPDGSTTFYEGGTIMRGYEASADFCKELEGARSKRSTGLGFSLTASRLPMLPRSISARADGCNSARRRESH